MLLRFQQLLDARPVGTAQRELATVAKNHDVLSTKPRLQFLNAFEVHNRRAVNSQETFRVEASFETLHGFADQVSFLPHVQVQVVPCRLNIVDLSGLKKQNATTGFNDETLRWLA